MVFVFIARRSADKEEDKQRTSGGQRQRASGGQSVTLKRTPATQNTLENMGVSGRTGACYGVTEMRANRYLAIRE